MNFTHHYIQPSSLNTFIFCKRKWYYRDILKLTFKNENMKIGSYINDTHWQKIKKRTEQTFYMEKYQLKGRIDYIETENNKHIPIEIKKGKSNHGKVWKGDEMQLICYINMLNNYYNESINYGYILYKKSKEKIKIILTKVLQKKWISYILEMKSYMKRKLLPKIKNNQMGCDKCALQEYCKI